MPIRRSAPRNKQHLLTAGSGHSYDGGHSMWLPASLAAQMVKFDCNAGDPGSSPGLGRSPGEGNDDALQYCCLENSKDRGTWQAKVHGVTKSQTQLSN